MQRLVLVGGGHAHLSVLHALAKHRTNIDVVLITQTTHQTYSGMLPGWIAGHYDLSECQIDLQPLAEQAVVELVIDQVVGMDANRRCVALSDGSILDYDLLSIDVGGETNLSWLEAVGDQLLSIKPIGVFVQRWTKALAEVEIDNDFRLVVVGGGAAGVEIAFAAKYVFDQRSCNASVDLVVSDSGLLSGHAPGVSKRVRNLLLQRGITLHQAHAVGEEGGVLLGNGQHLQADLVIAATGSSPPCWLKASLLALDEHGYISVDATHRSRSHPEVFAAGDVCARIDTIMARSGVHAVSAGPVVAHNLIASITKGKLIRYRPHKRSLYLLATGPKHAVASWGAFSAAGHWVWRWKNWIDLGFMNKNRAETHRYEKRTSGDHAMAHRP
jgi:pyridine nucleotide-disulfide oxidoreductase family protein